MTERYELIENALEGIRCLARPVPRGRPGGAGLRMNAPIDVMNRVKGPLRRDLRTLARFIDDYCKCTHRAAPRRPISLKAYDVQAIYGKPLRLCDDCGRLLVHAFVKRGRCPMNPKPACKRCPQHCYAPAYRARIREVMKVSGRRFVLRGRFDYLIHLYM